MCVNLHVGVIVVGGCVHVNRFAAGRGRNAVQCGAVFIGARFLYVETLRNGVIAAIRLNVCAIIGACGFYIQNRAVFRFNDVSALFNGGEGRRGAKTQNPVLTCFAIGRVNANIGTACFTGKVYCFAACRVNNHIALCSACRSALHEIPLLSRRFIAFVNLNVRAVCRACRIYVHRFARILRKNGVIRVAAGISAGGFNYKALCAGGVVFPALHVCAVFSTSCGNVHYRAVFTLNDVSTFVYGGIRR